MFVTKRMKLTEPYESFLGRNRAPVHCIIPRQEFPLEPKRPAKTFDQLELAMRCSSWLDGSISEFHSIQMFIVCIPTPNFGLTNNCTRLQNGCVCVFFLHTLFHHHHTYSYVSVLAWGLTCGCVGRRMLTGTSCDECEVHHVHRQRGHRVRGGLLCFVKRHMRRLPS
jgi:hypothetical protein